MSKTHFPGVIAGAVLFLSAAALSASAQTFSVLHTFANNEGINPGDGLVLSGTNLYGAAYRGGAGGNGTVFAISTNGTSVNVLYTFVSSSDTKKADGSNPNGGLVLSGTTLYGTCENGGGGGSAATFVDQGVLFSLGATTKVYTNVFYFSDLAASGTNTTGAAPLGAPVLVGSSLYGTAAYGGNGGNGVVFAHPTTPSQSTLSILHHFTAGTTGDGVVFTNNDGAIPAGPLLAAGATLYGTTTTGGTNGQGVIFKVNTNGGNFQVIHHFNDDGANPKAGLVLSGATLYGMGGSAIFSLSTNGAGFAVLRQFNDSVGATYSGATPGLTLVGNTLYAAVDGNDSLQYGQVVSLATNGSAFTDYHDFTPTVFTYDTNTHTFYNTNADGAFPNGGLLSLNGALYGTAAAGGTNGNGVLFTTRPPIQFLTCQCVTGSFTFSFMTYPSLSYTVLQNTNLVTTNWTTFTNITGDGTVRQFVVPVTKPRTFFRVRQP